MCVFPPFFLAPLLMNSHVYHHVTIQRLLSVHDSDNPRVNSPRSTRANGMFSIFQCALLGIYKRDWCGRYHY